MAVAQPVQDHWKDKAIENAEKITDAWEVAKTYAARSADIILFLCLVMNIVQILPGVNLWPLVINTVIGIQAITLDIAGIGLADMARRASANNDKKSAGQAKWSSIFLIGLMMITVTLITSGNLWPEIKHYTDMADKALILIRVAATVLYGIVVHNLRHAPSSLVAQQNQTVQVPDLATILDELRASILTEMQTQNDGLRVSISSIPEPLDSDALKQDLVAQVQTLIANHSHDIDYTQLAAQLAPLIAPMSVASAHEEEQIKSETSRVTRPLNECSYEHEDEQRDTDNLTHTRSTKRASSGANKALQKVTRLVKKNEQITASELATKCGISTSYAGKLKKQVLAQA